MPTLQKLYDLMIERGRAADPRSKKEVDAILKKAKEAYGKLDKKKKEYFDERALVNPYLDSGIEWGDPKRKVKSALVCIDADQQEVVLVDAMRRNGRDVDMIISHHPEGRCLIGLTKVMPVQEQMVNAHGVPINVAEKLLAKRIGELNRGIHPSNHYQVVDAARLLDVPFMCCHSPADNNVQKFLSDFVEKRRAKMETVGDLLEAFYDIEELQEAHRRGAGPKAFSGSESSKLGKVFVKMTGGTSGNSDIYEHMSRAGVGTIVQMHMSEEHRKKAEKHHLNVVITGHMGSDSIGMNLVMDHFEKAGLELIPAGGFIRVKRKV